MTRRGLGVLVLVVASGCLNFSPGDFLRDAGGTQAVDEAPACLSRCQIPAPSCKNAVTRVTTRLRGCDDNTCELLPIETVCANGCDAATGRVLENRVPV